MACENIYARCVVNSNVVRKEPKTDAIVDETEVIVEKLGLIQDYITDLQSITRNWRPVAPPTPVQVAAPGGSQASNAAERTGAPVHSSITKSVAAERSVVRESRSGYASMSRHSFSTGSET